jgi:hypothetical protein
MTPNGGIDGRVVSEVHLVRSACVVGNLQHGLGSVGATAHLENGGREALLDHLLKFDLSTVDLRTVPKTTALLEQKIASLTPEKAWWLDVLDRGELPWGADGDNECPTGVLFDRYVRHASKQGARRRTIETQLGMFLTRHVPGLQRRKADYRTFDYGRTCSTYGYIYEFPPLADCRTAYTKMIQQEVEHWGADDDWSHEPEPADVQSDGA